MDGVVEVKTCKQCGDEKDKYDKEPLGGCWQDEWYCSQRCMHAAGDRNCCGKHCGCTKYSQKRRLLRKHRVEMRIMVDLIEEHGLDAELEERTIAETGNTGFWLGESSDMDEDSEEEDPEATAKQRVSELLREAEDRQNFITAVKGALKCSTSAERSLKRARE